MCTISLHYHAASDAVHRWWWYTDYWGARLPFVALRHRLITWRLYLPLPALHARLRGIHSI